MKFFLSGVILMMVPSPVKAHAESFLRTILMTFRKRLLCAVIFTTEALSPVKLTLSTPEGEQHHTFFLSQANQAMKLSVNPCLFENCRSDIVSLTNVALNRPSSRLPIHRVLEESKLSARTW